tara:strand:- start:1327 stop:2016 length:690 start_codon:yes stop_codon:yes gene_type:complete
MTQEETTKTEEISEIQKSDDSSVTSILAQLVKAQESRIDSFEKRFDGLETLIKEQNKNPVDKGVEDDTQKPAVEASNDVGDPDKLGETYAPSPKAQASIVQPQPQEVGDSKSDASSLTMGKADDSEDKKEDEKKEEVAKTEDSEDKDDKKEEVKKSDEKVDSEYEIVKTVRPALRARDDESTIPTGYQILKAISGGWNGQTSSAEEALVIAYNKLENGEFGNGLPGGAY